MTGILSSISDEIKTETDPVNLEILMQRFVAMKGVEREISKYLGITYFKIAMAIHNDLGKRGEQIAAAYLENSGYRILKGQLEMCKGRG